MLDLLLSMLYILSVGFIEVKNILSMIISEQKHRNMSAIGCKDTKAEIMLRKALWHAGIRYRKNWQNLPGTPDIVLTRKKIAIFVDGDFWHARGHQNSPGEQVKSNKAFWVNKLTRNVERDRDVNDALTELGWVVIRFWETDIKENLSKCVSEVLSYL